MSHNIVIVGAGFCGALAAKKLASSFYDDKDVSITLIDRNNFQTMQHQLFEVAAGRVKEGAIRVNLNEIFKRTKVNLVRDEVLSVDFAGREVIAQKGKHPYDTLILATGSKPTHFGIEGASEFTKPLWSYQDAVELREHIKTQFCLAKMSADPAERKKLLTFFVVGAGLTGVEMTGELAEWIPSLCSAYSIPWEEVRIIECDMLERAVMDQPIRRSKKVAKRLENMGVKLMLKTNVKQVTAESITVDGGGREQTIPTNTVIWAAGIEGSALMESVAEECSMAGRNRIKVDKYLMAEGKRGVYVGGDNMFRVLPDDERPAPQIIENAEQTAAVIAHNVKVAVNGRGDKKEYKPSFHGVMISIGGRYGVANLALGDLRIPMGPIMSMAAKHFNNMVYITKIAGLFRMLEYIEDEFLEVPDRRSFLSIRFRQPWRKR